MALLTIGIPVYNEEKYLAKTIESALSQSFTDFKLIISDNCSKDRSYEIAKEYAAKDNRIEVIRHRENIGMGGNFMYSLNTCSTKYFVWLGAHDIFFKDYLKKAIEALENNPNIVMAYPKSLLIDKDDVVMGSLDSNIDTLGLSIRERLFKVARELHSCTSIHGVFRPGILKKLPFEYMEGADQLILFTAALYGDIHMLEIEGIKRRQVRVETYTEIRRRWRREIIKKGRMTPVALFIPKHIEHICKCRDISIKEKVIISLGIAKIFFKKRHIVDSWRRKYPCFNYFYRLLKRLLGRCGD